VNEVYKSMKSIRELYRIGNGPSSSHTIAPSRASSIALEKFPGAEMFRVTLYGSLAATGRGHFTDKAIMESLKGKKVDIIWNEKEELSIGSNGMRFEALGTEERVVGTYETCSTGGGAISEDQANKDVYTLPTMSAILDFCQETGESLWEYVEKCEGADIPGYLDNIWTIMSSSIERGLSAEGVLSGGLGLSRKAHLFFRKSQSLTDPFSRECLLIAYAYAVSEENACGATVVTAPTCGASGVLPAVLRHLKELLSCDRKDILRALATAGIIGNTVKHNGSISGAMVGCQGEVGVACAMAAAAATQLLGGSVRQIEYASEMGLEHHLGLTCDPVAGLVQIPCIERNGHAATRAITCAHIALLSDGLHRISFDDAVAVLLETGRDLSQQYKETSAGGLARMYNKRLAERAGGANSMKEKK
jgi:L-serine dehydratase